MDKKIVAGEIVNKAKDGHLVPVEGLNTPILDQNGEIIGFMASHRDITERKKAQEQMEERRGKLIHFTVGKPGRLADGTFSGYLDPGISFLPRHGFYPLLIY